MLSAPTRRLFLRLVPPSGPLQANFDDALAAVEESHRAELAEVQRQHRLEIEQLRSLHNDVLDAGAAAEQMAQQVREAPVRIRNPTKRI